MNDERSFYLLRLYRNATGLHLYLNNRPNVLHILLPIVNHWRRNRHKFIVSRSIARRNTGQAAWSYLYVNPGLDIHKVIAFGHSITSRLHLEIKNSLDDHST